MLREAANANRAFFLDFCWLTYSSCDFDLRKDDLLVFFSNLVCVFFKKDGGAATFALTKRALFEAQGSFDSHLISRAPI